MMEEEKEELQQQSSVFQNQLSDQNSVAKVSKKRKSPVRINEDDIEDNEREDQTNKKIKSQKKKINKGEKAADAKNANKSAVSKVLGKMNQRKEDAKQTKLNLTSNFPGIRPGNTS